MTERSDLLGRLTELDAGTETHRATARSIQKMINHGDLAGAATALDDLETALHPALAAGGDGGGGSLPAVRVHWFKSPAWVVAAGERWDNGVGFGFATVDEDTDGFWDADQEAAIVPTGLGGRYAVQMFASYSSAVATGFINANPFGTNEASYGPCVFADDTNSQGLTHIQVVNMDDGSNDADEPSVSNLTDHDVKIARVELALVRIGGKP